MKKTILRLSVIFIVGISLGLLLLTAVFALPTEPMQKRVEGSVPIFEREGKLFALVPARISTMLNNQSDAMFLNIAITDGEGSALQRAMRCSFIGYGDYSPTSSGKLEDLVKRYRGTTEEELDLSYPRYWHGYQIVLKPLLLFMEYGGIRTLNMTLQLTLLCIVVLFAAKRLSGGKVFCLILGLLSLTPVVISLCMQYSPIYYILMITLMILLRAGDRLSESGRYCLFFAVGMASNFFDLLTYPLVTLGIPLGVCLLMERKDDFRGLFRFTATCILLWGLGFGLTWAAKWCIGSAVLGESLFGQVEEAALLRSGSEGGAVYRLKAIAEAVGVFACKPWFLYFTGVFVCAVIAILSGIRQKKLCFQPRWTVAAMLVLVGLMPFAWFFIFAQHTIYHPFTHRILAVPFFCFSAAIASLIGHRTDRDLQSR